MTVTTQQRQLAIEKTESLTTLFRDGTISLLTGKSKPEEAIPILDRLKELLHAADVDTDAILNDALERVSLTEEIEQAHLAGQPAGGERMQECTQTRKS